MSSPATKYGFTDDHWDSLSEFDRELYSRIRPMPRSVYSVHCPIHRIEDTLKGLNGDAEDGGGRLELEPDFQRGHVWSLEKKVAFVEAVLRGTAPMTIRFNCPSWGGGDDKDVVGLNPNSIQCIDGLQRLTALREFVAGKFTVYGDLSVEKLEGTSFAMNRMGAMWIQEVFQIKSRAELLQFYLDLNSGGVVHTPEEIERVKGLLQEASLESPPAAKTKAPRAKPAR